MSSATRRPVSFLLLALWRRDGGKNDKADRSFTESVGFHFQFQQKKPHPPGPTSTSQFAADIGGEVFLYQ